MTSSRQPRTSNPASRWWVAAPLVVASALALSACDRTKPGEPANSSAPMTPSPSSPSPSAPAVPVPQAGSGAANTTGGGTSNSMGTNDSGTGSSMPPASAASDAASMPRSTN